MTSRHALRVALTIALFTPAMAVAQTTQPPTPSMPTPPPRFFATGLVGTTLAFHPEGGEFDGPQKDVSPMFGMGYFFSNAVALELDAGPTFGSGNYASFSLMPGVVWSFHPNIYAAARFAVLVDPEVNLAIFPGVGVTAPVSRSLSVYVESNLWRNVGRGPSDYAIGLTVGLLRTF
jgi:hypothetical protein